MKLRPRHYLAALTVGLLSFSNAAHANDASLDKSVMRTLHQCQRMYTTCASSTKSAYGVLVFPSVVKADIIIGGAGGKGALIENGVITGYYTIGAGSAGLQIGVDSSRQVYVFQSQDALNSLKESQDWKVGANAGVTVVTADANAKGVVDGDVLAYIFKSAGLNGGLSVDVFDIWKTGSTRPHASADE